MSCKELWPYLCSRLSHPIRRCMDMPSPLISSRYPRTFCGSRREWGVTEKNREARFYSITAKGRKQLDAEEETWARLTEGVGRVLRYI